MIEALVSCLTVAFLSMFGMHQYDINHNVTKQGMDKKQNSQHPASINIYVGEANHYQLYKDPNGSIIWVPTEKIDSKGGH